MGVSPNNQEAIMTKLKNAGFILFGVFCIALFCGCAEENVMSKLAGNTLTGGSKNEPGTFDGLNNGNETSTEIPNEWDNEFLKLAYDQNYKYPTGFYYENDLAGSLYYVNTLSIKPITEREPPFIELHTLDKEEAKYWSLLTETNGSGNRVFVSENENEKYFEFLWVDKYEYIFLSRVHKSDYFIPLAELQDKFRKPNNTLGIYNGELTKSNIKELIEYLWDYPVRLHYGNKVIESVITETEDRFEHNIRSLEMVFGDWGVRDHISVFDNKFVFDKETRILTFVGKIKTDEL
jgi:hypothetical protein